MLRPQAWQLAKVAAIIIVASAIVVGAAALGASHRSPRRDPGGHMLLFTHGDPAGLGPMLASLEPARRAGSISAFRADVRPGDLLIIDRSAFGEVDHAFLQKQLVAGHPIMALNVQLSELVDASGYVTVLAGDDATAAKALRAMYNGRTGDASGFYGIVWVSGPSNVGCSWNGTVGGFVRDGLYRAHIHEAVLEAQRLTIDLHGTAVPLENLCGGPPS
jgi:hypothetical protein